MSIKWKCSKAERPKLVPYAGRFDGFHAVQASVSKTCLVRFDNNKYSVTALLRELPVIREIRRSGIQLLRGVERTLASQSRKPILRAICRIKGLSCRVGARRLSLPHSPSSPVRPLKSVCC